MLSKFHLFSGHALVWRLLLFLSAKSCHHTRANLLHRYRLNVQRRKSSVSWDQEDHSVVLVTAFESLDERTVLRKMTKRSHQSTTIELGYSGRNGRNTKPRITLLLEKRRAGGKERQRGEIWAHGTEQSSASAMAHSCTLLIIWKRSLLLLTGGLSWGRWPMW